MSAALIENFDLLASSLGGVAKLRELILSLAVRGQLVPQDPNDEPASELLKKIRAEKDRLIKEGKIKRDKLLTDIGEDEKPYELPEGWEWTRLGGALKKITDGTHHSPPNVEQGEFKYISAKNIKKIGIDLSAVTYVTQEVHEEIYSRCDPEYGDILYIKDGATTGIGAINTLREPFSMLSSVALLKPSCGITNKYLMIVLDSPFFYAETRAGMTGVAITRVTLSKLNDAFLPLPPLAEQSRIVAKVEELMALCDRLEAEQGHANRVQRHWVQVALDQLSDSSDADDFRRNWQHLASHWDQLFTTPASITALEATLLQLAVRGKLVAQDPNDQPASELLKQIRSEKDRLILEGKIKRDKPLPPITDDEKPYELPEGWEWARTYQVAESRLGKMLDSAKNSGSACPYLRNTNVQWQRFELSDIKEIFLEAHELIEYRLRFGDLLICEGGEPGRCAIWRDEREEMYFQKALHRVRPLGGVMPEYFAICLEVDAKTGRLEQFFTGATIKRFAGQELNRYFLALPPLAEQARIVAQIENLLSLTAELKARLTNAQTKQAHLAEVLIAETC